MASATTWSAAPNGWSGDLRDLGMRTWREDSDVVAIYVAADGAARGWTNLRHVSTPAVRMMVWLWVRAGAAKRPPVDVLYTADLKALRGWLLQEA